MSMREETCGNCLFWHSHPHEGDELGDCRRHAPRPRTVWEGSERQELFVRWPLMLYDGWCGEWHPQPQRQTAEARPVVQVAPPAKE
jgi:hypothetical protein